MEDDKGDDEMMQRVQAGVEEAMSRMAKELASMGLSGVIMLGASREGRDGYIAYASGRLVYDYRDTSASAKLAQAFQGVDVIAPELERRADDPHKLKEPAPEPGRKHLN